jgi:site-specific DNA-methyltransferase (adenine-specific)
MEKQCDGLAAFDRTLGAARVRLFLEDCVAGMARRLAPGSVSVVVTSPPYNLGIKYSGYDDTISRAEYLAWLGRWAEVVRSVLAEEGSLFLNVGSKPSDPWVPFEVVTEMRRHFHLQNVRLVCAEARIHCRIGYKERDANPEFAAP